MIHFCRNPGSYLLVRRSHSLGTSQEAGHHFAVQGILQAYHTGLLDARMLDQTVLNLNRRDVFTTYKRRQTHDTLGKYVWRGGSFGDKDGLPRIIMSLIRPVICRCAT